MGLRVDAVASSTPSSTSSCSTLASVLRVVPVTFCSSSLLASSMSRSAAMTCAARSFPKGVSGSVPVPVSCSCVASRYGPLSRAFRERSRPDSTSSASSCGSARYRGQAGAAAAGPRHSPRVPARAQRAAPEPRFSAMGRPVTGSPASCNSAARRALRDEDVPLWPSVSSRTFPNSPPGLVTVMRSGYTSICTWVPRACGL